jgi:hypothetical protein
LRGFSRKAFFFGKYLIDGNISDPSRFSLLLPVTPRWAIGEMPRFYADFMPGVNREGNFSRWSTIIGLGSKS